MKGGHMVNKKKVLNHCTLTSMTVIDNGTFRDHQSEEMTFQTVHGY